MCETVIWLQELTWFVKDVPRVHQPSCMMPSVRSVTSHCHRPPYTHTSARIDAKLLWP